MLSGRMIHSGDVEIFTESVGDPADPPIVLVMGAMASAVWWPEAFCRALAARGRFVVRFDHRDTGRSTSGPPGPIRYTVEELAADVVAVLDAHDLPVAHLCGMSLGGYLAQLVALAWPGRAATLTLIASERLAAADPDLPSMSPAILEYHAAAATLDWSDAAAVTDYQVGAWRLLHGSAHPFDEPHVRALVAEDLARTPDPLTPFNHAGLGGGDRFLGRLHELDLPALVIHGTEDPVLPYAHALALERDLPRTELVTLAGTGHELHPADWPTILGAIERHTAAGGR